ncbi:DUF637 domain-containing protein [Acinetobacter baumannii]|uniref:two-partner secretion domain-containing protein n=1 Tax=Acinetobacter baumannii TaxID=470 RepID=UPI00244B20EF|nr:DUF637 domain-containing protein [Acinetobacter baumannii]MDH2543916.1 DUF637 domain-containing protein [Acinetobacter baumannii]
MNKNSYRIIYSKARQMFVAVAENVRSQTKTSGQSEASAQSNIDNTESQAFHQLWQVKALVASISLWMPLAPVYAGIVADSAANAANRAVIGAGKNSAGTVVPVVNIQTPKNGISHNIYKQFDVLTEGAVLNNSRQGATTKTVGNVAANPFLATGEARVILNEVNSSAASRFEGNLEVAGQMADVIIANPSGINIKGGGFINANKAIFTTGKPQLNADGSIKQFTVDQGKITVSANPNSKFGLGGNNNDANYVDLYARALELSAELRAKNDIQVIAGANNVSADLQDVTAKTGTGTAPTLAVDVKALGGMYANNIYLMGTEKGLGVTNAGTIQAVNNLVITSAGKIEHSGTISSTSKTQGLVSVQTTGTGAASDINSSGSINSNSMLNIDSGNNLNVNAKEIIINNGSLASSPLIVNTKGNINLAANTRIMDDSQGGDVYIDAANINLAAGSELKSNRGTATIQVQKDLVAAKGAKLIAAQDLNVLSNGKLSLTENHIQASLGTINLQANSANTQNLIDLQGGTIYAGKDLNLYSSGDLNLKNLGFSLENAATRVKNIKAYSGRNLVWNNADKALPLITGMVQLDAANNLTVTAKEISNKDSIQLHANQIALNSALTSQKNIDVSSEIADLVLSQALKAQDNLTIASLNGKLTATGLNAVSTLGKISILGAKDTIFTNNGTVKTILKGDQAVVIGTSGTGNLTIQNTVLESQNGNILATSGAQNNIFDSTLTAKTNIELFAKDNLTLDGIQSTSQQHTALNSKKNIYINSQAASGDNPSFSSAKTSELSSSGVLSLVSEKNQNIQNTKFTGGAILIEAGGGLNTSKAVEFNATGSDLLKNSTKLNSLNGDLTIHTQDSLSIDPNIYFFKTAGDFELASKKGSLTLVGYSGQAGNGSERVVNLVAASGGISLDGASVDVQGAKFSAQKDIKIVSTQGNMKVDGIKNAINNQASPSLIQNINKKKATIEANIISIENNPEYISQKASLEKQLSQVGPQGGISGPPFLVANAQKAASLREAIANLFGMAGLKKELDIIKNDLNKYSSAVNGSEHAETNLITNQGNVLLSSAKGISISGATITAKVGQIDIEAQGSLGQQYTSTATKGIDGKSTQLDTSMVIDGHTNFYDQGNEGDENYSMRTYISPTVINGSKGVAINATGNTKQDNLVLQAAEIRSTNGVVKIEANKNILIDAAIEQSFDRVTTTEKDKSWGGLKTKYITTVSEINRADVASVDISGKNIFIESKEKNSANNIDIYSGKLNANGGEISIRSGGNINLYTVQKSSSSNVDITKKSSFAGIKYNKSNTNTTRTQISELPGILTADYIGIKAEKDVRLVGTEFEYLQGAKIEAGRDLSLLTASSTVSETLSKKKNSIVWQSMQDKGSITETAQLPSFNGPVLPTFKAAGGLSVQVPISEKDANKVELRDEILKLANQPGNAYLKELVNRKDVDWQQVLLTQKDWDYKSQGLTAAGAALIVIIVTIATMGSGTAAAAGAAGGTAASGTTVGLGASMIGSAGVTTATVGGVTTITGVSTLGAMANAAITSLATQASVGLINNGGDIGKTLKDLGSKDSVKNLAASVVTAGLLSQASTALNLKLDSTALSDRSIRLINNFTTSIGSTLVQTAIKGGDLEENLKVALLSGLAGALQGEFASQIGDKLDKVDPNVWEYTIHKIAHAAVGCATAAATKQSCEAGAIGAGVGEIVASIMPGPVNGIEYNEEEKLKIRNTGKIVAGVVSAYSGYDVNTAANSADIAIQNNSLVKLASTAGKILVKSLDELNAFRKAGKNFTVNDLKASIKKQGADELLGMADDLYSIFARNTSNFDRVMAAIDLVVGTDLKKSNGIASRKVEELIRDKAFVQSLAGKNVNTPALPNTPYHPDMVSLRALTQAEKNAWITQLPQTIVKQKVTVGGKAIDVDLTATLNRIVNNKPLNSRDGIKYQNISKPSLPYKQPGMPVSTGKNFEEWTVPTPGVAGRGNQRIIIDRDTGMLYYTPNHYGSAQTGAANTWRVLGKLP